MHLTLLPPIFLQRPQHSLTIVGISRTVSGKRRLLTFDPAWQAPKAMRGSMGVEKCSGWAARRVLGSYVKGERYLKRFGGFETVSVDCAV